MNIAKLHFVAAALLASSSVVHAQGAYDALGARAAELGGQTFLAASRATAGHGAAQGEASIPQSEFYGLRSEPRNIFRQTQGQGMGERAGFGGVNDIR